MQNSRRSRGLAGVALAVLAASSLAWAQSLDLAAGLLNGVPVCGMTLDDLGDELGRPSAVEPESGARPATAGPGLRYHPLGVRAWFYGAAAAGAGTLQGLQVHVVETWDEDYGVPYAATPVSFASGVTLDWRTDDVLAAFARLGPRDIPPDVGHAEYHASGLAFVLGARELADFLHVVEVRVDERVVRFHHEPTTRYLEFVTIGCNVGD